MWYTGVGFEDHFVSDVCFGALSADPLYNSSLQRPAKLFEFVSYSATPYRRVVTNAVLDDLVAYF